MLQSKINDFEGCGSETAEIQDTEGTEEHGGTQRVSSVDLRASLCSPCPWILNQVAGPVKLESSLTLIGYYLSGRRRSFSFHLIVSSLLFVGKTVASNYNVNQGEN